MDFICQLHQVSGTGYWALNRKLKIVGKLIKGVVKSYCPINQFPIKLTEI